MKFRLKSDEEYTYSDRYCYVEYQPVSNFPGYHAVSYGKDLLRPVTVLDFNGKDSTLFKTEEVLDIIKDVTRESLALDCEFQVSDFYKPTHIVVLPIIGSLAESDLTLLDMRPAIIFYNQLYSQKRKPFIGFGISSKTTVVPLMEHKFYLEPSTAPIDIMNYLSEESMGQHVRFINEVAKELNSVMVDRDQFEFWLKNSQLKKSLLNADKLSSIDSLFLFTEDKVSGLMLTLLWWNLVFDQCSFSNIFTAGNYINRKLFELWKTNSIG